MGGGGGGKEGGAHGGLAGGCAGGGALGGRGGGAEGGGGTKGAGGDGASTTAVAVVMLCTELTVACRVELRIVRVLLSMLCRMEAAARTDASCSSLAVTAILLAVGVEVDMAFAFKLKKIASVDLKWLMSTRDALLAISNVASIAGT